MNTNQDVIAIDEVDCCCPFGTVTEDDPSKVLKLVDGENGFDFLSLAGMSTAIASFFSSLSSVKESVKYVVDIAPEKLKAIEEGTLGFNVRKDGKILAQTTRINENGKKVIDSNLPMHVENSFDVSSLISSLGSLCMQAQLQQIRAELADIKEACARIEKGQHDDRVGSVIGGRDSLEQALSEGEIDKHLLSQAVSTLNNARGQLGLELLDKCKKFKSIPKTKFGQILKSTFSRGYCDSKDREAEEIWECYYLYSRATSMVAYAHAVQEKSKAAENAIKESEVFRFY